MNNHALALLFALLFLLPACSSAQPASDPTPTNDQSPYRIELVKGDVYRFSAGHYHSAFLVSESGIVLTDPISRDAAAWLKAELARRFEQPVRYVIYSHSHPDHTNGGDVFDDPSIVFVSHTLTRRQLEHTKAETRLPDVTFDEQLVLRIDDHAIRLRYHGPNNGRGSISMHFENDRVMHVVDWIVLGRLPYKNLDGYDIHGVIDSTREVLEIDFDTFIGGHADVGTKDDIRRYLAYVESLHEQVLVGMKAEKSLEQIKRDVDLSEYADLKMYDEWRDLNIEGLYESLRDDSYILMQ